MKHLKRWSSAAEAKLNETKLRLTKRGAPIVPDQIVANAMFGFWLDLFHNSFEDAANPLALWPHCFASAFPYSSVPDRATMESKLRQMKDFRNRLSHHEPAWKASAGVTPLSAETDLNNYLSGLLEIMGAVSPQLVLAFERTGLLDRLRWLVSAKTLNAFAAITPPKQIDRRKLTGEVKRSLKKSQAAVAVTGTLKPNKAISISDSGKPVAILTPIH